MNGEEEEEGELEWRSWSREGRSREGRGRACIRDTDGTLG